MTTSATFPINPVAKPRMTRSDKWKLRPVVAKYRAYKDDLTRMGKGYKLPESFTVTFGMELPKSMPTRKKESLLGMPHKQRPDVDNLLKGLMDALLDEDSRVWNVTAKKIWVRDGFVRIVTDEDSQVEGL